MDTLEILGKIAAFVATVAGAIGAIVAVRNKLKSSGADTKPGNSTGDRINISAGRDASYIKDSFNRRDK